MEKVIFDIRKSVLNQVNLSNQKYKNGNNELNRITYEVQNKIYVELLKILTVDDMVKFSNTLIALSKTLQKKYIELATKYQNEKDDNKRKELYSQIELQVWFIDAYNTVINLINAHLNRYYKNVPISKINNSSEIIDLLIKYMSLDPNSVEASELYSKLYNIKDERQMLIESMLPTKSGKYVFEIESLEFRCARIKGIKDIDGEIKSDKFIELFDNNLKIINEYGFKKSVNQDDMFNYEQALRNIKNLLFSLELDESFIDGFIMDVIRFNLNEDYRAFESLNGTGFSKKNYNAKIDEIKEKINSIKSNAIRKGKIVVSNRLETYDDLMSQINDIYNEIEDEYNKTSDELGGSSVLR